MLNAPPPLSLTRGALRRGSWQTGGTGGHGFMKAPWPPLVEVAFWFVPLIGASHRTAVTGSQILGGTPAGSLPWKPEGHCGERVGTIAPEPAPGVAYLLLRMITSTLVRSA